MTPTIDQLTDGTAHGYAATRMIALGRDSFYAYDDFTSGVEWERARNKWTYVEGRKENLPPPGTYWVIYSFSISPRPELKDFPQKDMPYEDDCDWWRNYVKCYQPIPEAPKEKPAHLEECNFIPTKNNAIADKTITWGDLKKHANELPDEFLDKECIIWWNDEGGTKITDVMILDEDYVEDAEGAAPISVMKQTFNEDDEDDTFEDVHPVIYKKGHPIIIATTPK